MAFWNREKKKEVPEKIEAPPPVHFVYFQSADGLSRMVPVSPTWISIPIMILPLNYATKVHDWVEPQLQDSSMQTTARRYRLEREEMLDDGFTRIYTYIEIP